MIKRQEKVDIHCNLFDSSSVEYFTDGASSNFDIVFDQKLYDAPKIVLELEKSMAEQAAKQQGKFTLKQI